MNRKTQIIRAGICAVLGLAFAGSAVSMLAAGMGLAADAATIYISAFAAAVLAGLCTCSGMLSVIAGILLVCGLGAAAVFTAAFETVRNAELIEQDANGNWKIRA